MKKSAVYGIGIGFESREVGRQATQHALDQLGSARPVLGLVFVAQEFDTAEVLAGITSLLGETPLWGFSTTRPLTGDGDQPRSVVVALLTGSELRPQVHWFPTYAQDSQATARQFYKTLEQGVFLPQEILLAADGINGSLAPICAMLGDLRVPVAGCMAAGEPSLGKTYAIGKNQSGPGALSAVTFNGRCHIGVGLAHGWKALGIYFRVTRTRDVWIQTLNDLPAAETYAKYFGYSAREWAFPPLTDMARLYPLGMEPQRSKATRPFVDSDPDALLVRSALRVEVDGSLRMSGPVEEGATVHLMAADPEACLDAAQTAAETALRGLYGRAKPLLAVALVDAAWQTLFEAHPNQISLALRSVLGEVPLVGAYTYGQLVRPDPVNPPVLHNQNIEVLVIGEGE